MAFVAGVWNDFEDDGFFDAGFSNPLSQHHVTVYGLPKKKFFFLTISNMSISKNFCAYKKGDL